MTEKRFNIHSDEENESIWISDVEKHKEIEIQHYYGIATVVKELNALHEENQALKKKIDIMADAFLQSNDLIEIEQVFYTKVCEPSEHFDEETLSIITNSLLGSDEE